MDRVDCILTAMERIKQLYDEAITCHGKVIQREKCMFDPKCPIAGCPFKIKKPEIQTLSVNRKDIDRHHLRRPIRKAAKYDQSETQEDAVRLNEGIVDDADVFVVRVDLGNSCQTVVLEHQDQDTMTDFLEEFLPPPSPTPSKSKSTRRQKGKSSKWKASKSGGGNKKKILWRPAVVS